MRNSSLTPIQERLLNMLGEVVALCEANDIAYYAAGGTALGAVRHGGFIPWDDDVDLMMPRNDWERFVKLAMAGQLPRDRELCCLELDASYPHVFGRYVDTTSCCVHYNQLLGGTPEGLCIDIFILDPVPDAGVGFDSHREALALYNDVANELGYSYPMSADSKRIEKYSRRVKREGRRETLCELEAEVARYDQGEYLVMRWACAPRLFHKSIFGFKRYLDFEDLRISVPARLNDYLVQHYGDDWPCLPPEEQRAVHDAFTFVDIGYRAFQDDYLPFLDVERTRRAILARREYHVKHMDDLRRAEDMEANILAVFAREETLARAFEYEQRMQPQMSADSAGKEDELTAGSSKDARVFVPVADCKCATTWSSLQHALEEGSFAELEFVFGEYYRIQGSPELLGREEYMRIRRYYEPVMVDLDDELVSIALRNLANTGRLALAARILAATERVRGELPPAFLSVRRLVDAVRMPASLADVGLEVEACDFACCLPELLPNSLPAALAFLKYCPPEKAGCSEYYDAILNRASSLFPENGELLKFRADRIAGTATSAEGAKEAKNLYARALEQSNNAFVVEEVAGILASEDLPVDSVTVAGDGEGRGAAGATGNMASATSGDPERVACWPSLKLLDELMTLCVREGIPCCLGPLSCAYALVPDMNYGVDGPPELDVLVPSGYLRRLANAVIAQRRSDRMLDCWLTNPRHVDSSLDYVDSTTTFLNLDDGPDVMAPGFRVRAHAVVVGRSDLSVQAMSTLESGWVANGYRMTKQISMKTAAQAASARAAMLMGRRRAAKRLFAFVDGGAQSGGASALAEAARRNKQCDSAAEVVLALPGGWKHCDCRMLFPMSSLDINGVPYMAPAEPMSLLETTYGRRWRMDVAKAASVGRKTMVSARVFFDSLLTELAAEGVDADELYALMQRIRLGMIPRAGDLRTRNRAMLIAQRSNDRKRWFEVLNELDAEIAQCRASGDWGFLGDLLGDYKSDAVRYLSKGMSLVPNKHYLDILCELLEHDGEREKAARIRRLAPKQHYLALE